MTDILFQKTLKDLIEDIRSNKKNGSVVISEAIAECKKELKSQDNYIKAEAIKKLTYLQMMGYDISWAAFSIIEVMSMSRFAHKRLGFLAANQSFNDKTDLVMLATNLLKLLFGTASGSSSGPASTVSSYFSLYSASSGYPNENRDGMYEIGLGLSGISNFATSDMGKDCLSDVVTLLKHRNPYVRKKAVLSMYKIYVKFPQGLRLTFEKLQELLEDTDVTVVSAVVNVICELANRNPKNFLSFAPKFFKLLTNSTNNWMLIKVVKLMSSLVSVEPRLARKLLEPLTQIARSTSAKSLQYECIYTLTQALLYSKREDGTEPKSVPSAVKLCSDILRGFLVESDQNLKYLGIVGFIQLLESAPQAVVDCKDLVLRCLNDEDLTIRIRSLELLNGIVSRKTLVEFVTNMILHVKVADGAFRNVLVETIISMCCKDKYANVTDFKWLIVTLIGLAILPGGGETDTTLNYGDKIADCLIDVAVRVEGVRKFLVQHMLKLKLSHKDLLLGQASSSVASTLKAAAWICGEYINIASDIKGTNDVNTQRFGTHVRLLYTLLHPRVLHTLAGSVQAVYLESTIKVFVSAVKNGDTESLSLVLRIIRMRLPEFVESVHVEVQERAYIFYGLLSTMGLLPTYASSITKLYRQEWRSAKLHKSKSQKDTFSLIQFSLMESVDQVACGSKCAQVELEDLLCFLSLVSTEDKQAASEVQLKKNVLVLEGLIGDKFYSVHSKAQRKVPVPQHVIDYAQVSTGAAFHLDQPIHKGFAKIFIDFEDPFANNSKLCSSASGPVKRLSFMDSAVFLSPAVAVEKKSIKGSGYVSESQQNSLISSSSASSSSQAFAESSHPAVKGYGSEDNKVFHLGNQSQSSSSARRNADMSVFSTGDLLYNDIGGAYDTPEKSKKEKKKKKSKQVEDDEVLVEIDRSDLVPAGAVSDEDERKKPKKSKSKQFHSEDSMTLDKIDLTAPLQEHEVMPVLQHRVVEQGNSTWKDIDIEVKEDRHNKKNKSKRSKKSDAVSSVTSDLLDLSFTPSELPVSHGQISVKDSLVSNNLSADRCPSGVWWCLLQSTESVSCFYSLKSVATGNIEVSGYLKNSLKHDIYDITISFNWPPRALTEISSNKILKFGSCCSAKGLVLSDSLILEVPQSIVNLSLCELNSVCELEYKYENILQQMEKVRVRVDNRRNNPLTMYWPLHYLSKSGPPDVSQEFYAKFISKSSSKWTESSVTLEYAILSSVTSKSKYVLKMISEAINATVVDQSLQTNNEVRAASMYVVLGDDLAQISIACKFFTTSTENISVEFVVRCYQKSKSSIKQANVRPVDVICNMLSRLIIQ